MSKIARYTEDYQCIRLSRIVVISSYIFIPSSLLLKSLNKSQLDKVRPNPSNDFRVAT